MKQYSCIKCDKVFSLSQHRVSHIRTRTGEKSFTCSSSLSSNRKCKMFTAENTQGKSPINVQCVALHSKYMWNQLNAFQWQFDLLELSTPNFPLLGHVSNPP